MYKFRLFLLLGLLVAFTACKKEDSETVTPPLEALTFNNLAAPGDVRDRNTGQIIQTNPFVYFSFEKGTTVSESENWDIGFKGTTLIFNSGVSGNGQGGAIVKLCTFDELIEAPESSEFRQDADGAFAVPTGSDNGWYNYSGPPTFVITPLAGRIIMVKTFDGKYAKVEILSYYKDAPAQPTRNDVAGTYTFRYMYQADGSRTLK